MDEFIAKLDDLIEAQKKSATYDEYMRGLTNGLIVARSVASGEEPIFVSTTPNPTSTSSN